MKQYIYIPIAHEVILANAVNLWTSAPNYGWTIIVGVYKPTEVQKDGDSIVRNVLRVDRQEVLIPYTIQDLLNNNKKGLVGFCLEGDLDLYAPDFKAVLQSFEDVKFFDTSFDYLTYIMLV